MFTHGMTKTVRLAITSIATDLNTKGKTAGKLTIAVIPEDPYYTNSAWTTTDADLTRLAKECGAYDRFTFAKIVNNVAKRGGEDSELVLHLQYCVTGQPIGQNADGTTILSKEGSAVYTKTFWNVRDYSISIGDDVSEKLDALAMQVGIELAKDAVNDAKLAARAEKRERDIARAGGDKPTVQTPVDTGLDGNP